jgi:chorismate mutase
MAGEVKTDGTDDPGLHELRGLLAVNDRALLDLVNKRLDLVRQIKQRKAELGIAFVDPEREAWLLDLLRKRNEGPLSDQGLHEFLAMVLDLTKRELGR